MPGRVQCTKETASMIQQQQSAISIEARGKMEIKGRGKLETFFLNYRPTENEVVDYADLRPERESSSRKKPEVRVSVGNFLVEKDDAKRLAQIAASDEEQGLSGEMDFPSDTFLKSGEMSMEE